MVCDLRRPSAIGQGVRRGNGEAARPGGRPLKPLRSPRTAADLDLVWGGARTYVREA